MKDNFFAPTYPTNPPTSRRTCGDTIGFVEVDSCTHKGESGRFRFICDLGWRSADTNYWRVTVLIRTSEATARKAAEYSQIYQTERVFDHEDGAICWACGFLLASNIYMQGPGRKGASRA
ncbi:MAG: hypothetical protein V4671_24935 [Armatimonadota bacterium]